MHLENQSYLPLRKCYRLHIEAPLSSSFILLIPDREQGIDSGGAGGRDIAGGRHHRHHDDGGRGKSDRVAWTEAVENLRMSWAPPARRRTNEAWGVPAPGACFSGPRACR